jgi:hypothetical protein
MSAPSRPQILSIYRRILRELPIRQPSATSTHLSQQRLSSPSQLQKRIRTLISTPHGDATSQAQQAEQFVKYVQAQRQYVTLVERYNPGMDMSEEERVRLTARRVGMEMPESWYGKK